MSRLFAGTPFDIPPTCERCGKPEEDCQCEPAAASAQYLPPSKQRAKVRVDRRKHKRMITVVWGLSAEESDLPALLSVLKGHCGAGGSLVEGTIEVQGDHAERISGKLKEIGYRVG